MKVTVFGPNIAKHNFEYLHPKDRVDIVLDANEVEDATSVGGPSVARILVENEQGIGAYFHISVRIKRGRPVVDVSTEPHKEKAITKSVTGVFNRL